MWKWIMMAALAVLIAVLAWGWIIRAGRQQPRRTRPAARINSTLVGADRQREMRIADTALACRLDQLGEFGRI